ncbi:MAG: O-antigen ligase family protein [Methylobacter sp.]
MTDYGFLFALAVALVIAIDPIWMGYPLSVPLGQIHPYKHLAGMMALPALLLTLVGDCLFFRWQKRSSSLSSLWPLLAFSALIVIGSGYARVLVGVQDTFMIFGLYIWAAPMAATMLLRCGDPQRLLRTYIIFLLAGGAWVFAGLAVNYGVKQVYHELEYLFPPLAVFFVFRYQTGQKWMRWAGVSFFLLTALLFKKNTGYLTGLLVVGYLFVFYVWPQWSRLESLRKMVKIYALVIIILVAAALAALLLLHRDTYLPTGNTEFRVLTYELAWARFLKSPLWGTGFTGAGAEKFTGYDTGVSDNILPTHSDILDILAQGGLIGITLWLWGLLRVARLACKTILHPRSLAHPLAPYGHMLACASLAAVLTYAVNPILLQTTKAMLLWTNLGFLVGISLMVGSPLSEEKNK